MRSGQQSLRRPASIRFAADRDVRSLCDSRCDLSCRRRWAIGSFAESMRLHRRQPSSSIAFAFTLVGLALGWQAVLTYSETSMKFVYSLFTETLVANLN